MELTSDSANNEQQINVPPLTNRFRLQLNLRVREREQSAPSLW